MALPNERISQYTQRERQQFHQGHDIEPAGLRDAYGQVERLVRENPGYAVLATFATGLGVGLLLAGLAAPKRRDSLRFHDHLGENAREAIQSAVARFVPEAVSRFLSKQR